MESATSCRRFRAFPPRSRLTAFPRVPLIRIAAFGCSLAAGCAHATSNIDHTPGITQFLVPEALPFSQSVAEAMKVSLRGSEFEFGGFGSPTERGRVSLLVVNQEDAMRSADCPPRDKESIALCRWLTLVADNCLLSSSRTIACDLHFLWRSYRYAHVLTLSSLVNPQTKKPYVDRYNFARAAFEDSEKRRSLQAMKDDMRAVESFYDRFSDLRSTRDHILAGFLRFWLAHEVGHLVNGDSALDSIPCGDSVRESLTSVCMTSELPAERAADDFADRLLEQDLSRHAHFADPNEDDSWARVVPEYFRLELERIEDEARRTSGFSIEWAFPSATQTERATYLRLLASISIGDGHPTYLKRYQRSLAVLARGGVALSRSMQIVAAHTALLDAANATCNAVPKGATK